MFDITTKGVSLYFFAAALAAVAAGVSSLSARDLKPNADRIGQCAALRRSNGSDGPGTKGSSGFVDVDMVQDLWKSQFKSHSIQRPKLPQILLKAVHPVTDHTEPVSARAIKPGAG
jgi:hypothetical protein